MYFMRTKLIYAKLLHAHERRLPALLPEIRVHRDGDDVLRELVGQRLGDGRRRVHLDEPDLERAVDHEVEAKHLEAVVGRLELIHFHELARRVERLLDYRTPLPRQRLDRRIVVLFEVRVKIFQPDLVRRRLVFTIRLGSGLNSMIREVRPLVE